MAGGVPEVCVIGRSNVGKSSLMYVFELVFVNVLSRRFVTLVTRIVVTRDLFLVFSEQHLSSLSHSYWLFLMFLFWPCSQCWLVVTTIVAIF